MFKFTAIIACITVLALTPALAQTAVLPPGEKAPPAPSGQTKRNAVLSDAASITEDLIGFALDGQTAKVAAKVSSLRQALVTLRPLLDDQTYEVLERRTTAMEKAVAGKDALGAALVAVEAYRIIENAMDAAGRTAPVEVAMLDYAGFKLSVLAAGKRPNWARITATAKESGEFWSALGKTVSDKSMHNLIAAIQEGLNSAVARKDINSVKFAAKVLLEAVDVLEQYFRGTYKTPGGNPR